MNLIVYNKSNDELGILVRCLNQFYCIMKPMYKNNMTGFQYITNSHHLTDLFIWED